LVFKRRERRTFSEKLRAALYPKGGWGRALSYTWHRLRRLPDRPARIARGVGCGVFVCFTPLFGLHFVFAVLLARLIQGNKVAAFLSTFFGNPITFPLIATVALEMGEVILQVQTPIPLSMVLGSFASAFGEFSSNLVNVMTFGSAEWERLSFFFYAVFVPYLVGGLIPGLIAAFLAYFLSHKIIQTYQKRRRARAIGRAARKRAAKADKAAAAP
jgi:uncharacterized protein (DUF2062 family)